MTSLLRVRGLALDDRLHATDLEIAAGEMVAVIGPNGGGKTSLLRAIMGVERTSGTATVAGEDLTTAPPARRPKLATFLPASRELLWPISVTDLIALGLPTPDPNRVEECVELLELGPIRDRLVDRLSTGERARVLLARALAPRPRLLLLDEPLSNLDPYWVLRLLDILRQAVGQHASALVALHDLDRIPHFDRVVLVEAGALRADLPPDIVIDSQELATAFRIERAGATWRITRTADPRSLP